MAMTTAERARQASLGRIRAAARRRATKASIELEAWPESMDSEAQQRIAGALSFLGWNVRPPRS